MDTLKKFIRVSYSTPFEAREALYAAESKFASSLLVRADNLNHVEGNCVFFVKTKNAIHDNQVFDYLLQQNGALPAGCHVRA